MPTRPDPFSAMYDADARDRKPFGSHWTGPDRLRRVWTEIARYPRFPADGEGTEVRVFCSALPARFYKIVAAPTEDHPGFTLSTGSGMGEWAAETAERIAEGMITVPRDGEDA